MADRDDGPRSTGAGAGAAVVPAPTVSVTLSGPQLTLLETGYVLDYAGHGSADGRPAELVTVDRPDGTLHQWTYAEFEAHANKVANALRSLGVTARKKVIGPDNKVIMYMETTVKSITPKTFDILRAGLMKK